MTILDLQNALIAAGFNPGSPDGVMGPRTRAAIIAYQKANGLEADGIVGPVTAAALFGKKFKATKSDEAIPLHMPWLIEAARHIGLKEGIGKANNNKVIMDWADDLDAAFPDDETPWCGLFVAHCMTATLPNDSIPVNFLGARQWTRFGNICKPQLGSILVFWRGKKDGWMGHVGFYWADDEDKTHFHVLGGNQSNQVSVMRIERNRLLEARWPASLPTRGITRSATAKGVLTSVNEA
jgi:uncharacterized protein (TIGR02594 family)